ncbi:hypothetical protein VNO80_25109 [Phaseolus coccineus]|uniref:Uncharacterized protein n=1 Tax=Phaseolus coccineus TaxID=3886 RepID=A0AAN9LU67_PHACN
MPTTPIGDGVLLVAETPSKYGSDFTYSLVVRRPWSVVAIHFGGSSASSIAHVCLLRDAASLSGARQRLLEVGECSSSNSQEVGFACLDRIKEASRKTNVRLVSNFIDITDNGAKNCNRMSGKFRASQS